MKTSSFFDNKKGGSVLIEILVPITLVISVLMIATQIPRIAGEMISLMSANSGESVSRDISSLLAISGCAIGDAEISYSVDSGDMLYNIIINERVVEVVVVDEDGNPFDSTSALVHGYSKIPFDFKAEIDPSKYFTIEKIDISQDTHDMMSTWNQYKLYSG